MWADFQVSIQELSLFERNIFVIETFALSPLIPELYWFSWESLWSVFGLWSMVLQAYLSDDSLMWADFQVNIKDASFREEHFCHWNFRSISSHSWVVLILVRMPLECFGLWSKVLLAYLSDDSLMWADFQVNIKDASFREEHFCHWNFRSISSHSWVVLILVRMPLECFGLWSKVLLAYLSDDSLMWADFQVNIKDASFREEHFCHWNFRSISSHSWVVLILVRMPLECFGLWSKLTSTSRHVSWFSSLYKRCVFSRGTFLSLKLSLYLLSFLSCIDSREKAFGVFWIMIHGASSVFIWRLVDVSWFSVSNKSWALREEHFCHWNFRSISPHPWVILILVRKPLGVLDYDPWSFKRIYLTTRWCEQIFKLI